MSDIIPKIISWPGVGSVKGVFDVAPEEPGAHEDLLVELDLEGRVVFIDPSTLSLVGRDEADLLDQDWFAEVVPSCCIEDERRAFQAMVSGGLTLPLTREGLVRAFGERRNVLWHQVLLLDDDGEPMAVRLSGAVLDGGRTEPALRHALKRLHELRYALDQASIVAATDRRGIITYVNDRFCEVSGYLREELLGQDHRLISSDHHPASFFRALWREIGRGQIWRGDICNRTKDGRAYWVATTIVPYVDHRGRPYQYLAIRTEITSQKRVEQLLARTVEELERANHKLIEDQSRMLQAEKLSSVGLLAAGVAHEINNPLAGTMACIRALRDERVPPARRETYFETVLDGLERIQGTVKALLNYARPTSVSRGATCPADVISASLVLLTPTTQKLRLNIVHDESDAIDLEADRSQLMQAVMNVLLNATHAAPKGSDLRIEYPVRDGMCGIRITDQGAGIEPEALSRVCDPFFSTKAEGEGTGLGLSVTQGIVKAHGGELEIESVVNQGTAVTLWLRPASD